MGFYAEHVLPPLLHLAMRQKNLRPYRERVIAQASGCVLEIGVGPGLNVPLYGPTVHNIAALDPSPPLLRRARDQAALARVPVELIEGSGEALPFESASFDTVVMTWTLCSIPDARRALAEMRRVLRPAGALLFVEHGRAPEPKVARWQDRLDPLWSPLAGGCHLNRRIDSLISEAGFRVEAMHNSRLPGPRTHTFLYEGRARPG
jgi:ubiquinone/menaquinone biosynthesis C-methylase UbiE